MTTTTNPEDTSEPGNTPSKGNRLRNRLRQPVAEPDEPLVKDPFGGEVHALQVDRAPTDHDLETISSDAETEGRQPDASDIRAQKFERLGLRGATQTKAIKDLREAEDKTLVDWLRTFETDGPMRVQLKRKEPKEFVDPATGAIKKVDGHLRTYERAIDEVEIQRNHGGGTFQLIVQKRQPNGQFLYLTARTLEIGGDPRLNDVPRNTAPGGTPAPVGPAPSSGMDGPVMMKLVDGLFAKANQPAPAPPDVTGQLQAAMAPFIEMNRRLEAALERKDAEMREMRKADPAEATFQQKMLDKFVDGDTVRLQAVRAQYESEIRMLKESFIENEKRIRDQLDRDKQAAERAHEREINTFKSSYDTKVAALEQSFAMQKTVLETDNRRLERELVELRSDVKELRNKKEPSFKDQLSGIRDMKDMIADVVGDDDAKEEKSTVVKVFEGLAGSDVVAGFAQRIMAGGGGAVTQAPMPVEQQQLAAAQQRRRGPRLIRDRRNGQVYATDGQKAIPVQKKQPLAAPPPPQVVQPPPQVVIDDQGNQVVVQPPVEAPVAVQPEPVMEVPIPYIAPEQVALATDYMQKAFGNNIDPGDFVIGVKPFVPKEVIQAIAAMGVESFLEKVGGLQPDHPLLSQRGKNWSRKVGRLLVGE